MIRLILEVHVDDETDTMAAIAELEVAVARIKNVYLDTARVFTTYPGAREDPDSFHQEYPT